jgi:5-methylcytosine-specific restriction protein A
VPNTYGQGSTRAWRKVRVTVLQRDKYQCQLRYTGCAGHATEVDHITNLATTHTARRDAIEPDECQAVCKPCHDVKTAQERRRPRVTWLRPAERHPGLK